MNIQSVSSTALPSYNVSGAAGFTPNTGSSPSVTPSSLGSSTPALTSSSSSQFSMLSQSGASSEPLQALATLLLTVSLLGAMSGKGGENDSGKAAGMLALAGALSSGGSGGDSFFLSMSSTSVSSGQYDASGAAVTGGAGPQQIDTVA